MAKQEQDLLDRIMSSLSIRGFLFHPATLFLVASIAMIGGAIFLWEGHQERIVNDDEYRLTQDKIRVTQPPSWADKDLKQLVMDESGDSIASILDTSLVARTAKTFRNVGFVERVKSIEKSKSGLDIDLVYRTPVALVELSELTLPTKWPVENRGKRVLLPVDRLGVLMPESIGKGKNLPLITIPFPAKFANLKTWSDWPDARIKDAAAISSMFDQPLTQLGISSIVTKHFQQPESIAKEKFPFVLYSGTGTRIIWGNAPGKEIKNEVSAEAKIKAINSIVQQHGKTLDKINLGKIDIRSGKPVQVGQAKTAATPDELFLEMK